MNSRHNHWHRASITPLLLMMSSITNSSSGQIIYEDRKIIPNGGGELDQFGHSVAFEDGLIAIGANWDTDHTFGDTAGSVYLFDAKTMTQLVKIVADDAHEGHNFGQSVALHYGILAVGALSSSCPF